MSDSDRKKWDSRYAGRRDEEIGAPSRLLIKALQELNHQGRALDIACGSGRNALFLAEAGYRVDALDVSAEGLERGRRVAGERGLSINWLQADLDWGMPVTGPYDLIVMIRYLDLPLLEKAVELLNPGGWLVAEVFTDPGESDGEIAGPRNHKFLARRGALLDAASGLDVRHHEEGPAIAADGRTEVLARVIGRRSE